MTNADIDLLVTGATVVTCDEDQQVIYNGGLAVKNGQIEKIGTDKDLAPFKDKGPASAGTQWINPYARPDQSALPRSRQSLSRAG